MPICVQQRWSPFVFLNLSVKSSAPSLKTSEQSSLTTSQPVQIAAMTLRRKSVFFLKNSLHKQCPSIEFHLLPLFRKLRVFSRVHSDLLQNLPETRFLLPLTVDPFLPFPRKRIFQNLFSLLTFESKILPHSSLDALSFPLLLSIATISTSACLAAPSARCSTADTN